MANSRTKGKGGEYEVSDLIFNNTGVRLTRNLDQVREGGYDLIVDVEKSGRDASMELIRFFSNTAIEVKRYKDAKASTINGWWEQAVRQSLRYNNIPILVYRLDRQRWNVVVPSWFVLHDGMVGLERRTSENSTLEYALTMSVTAFLSVLNHKFGEFIKVNGDVKPVSEPTQTRRSRRVVTI